MAAVGAAVMPAAVMKRREGLRFPPRAAPGPSPPRALSSLPLSRVKLIMKSCPDVSSINQDALFLTAKATEQFVQYLALYAYKSSKDKKELTYNELADCVENSETFQFLADILPKKILASEYLKMLEEEREGGGADRNVKDEEDDKEEDDDNEQDEDEDENES